MFNSVSFMGMVEIQGRKIVQGELEFIDVLSLLNMQ